MLKDYWGEIPDTPEAREWVRQIMDRAIWTVKDVQGLYGLSQSTVSRLYTKHDWAFAFKKGSQILFLADYAKPWFDQYNAEQNINRSAEQLDPETGKRRPGRPKKVKSEEWRHTHFNGWAIDIPEEFDSPKKWLAHIHKQQMQNYQSPPGYGSEAHREWIATWNALKVHFNLGEGKI